MSVSGAASGSLCARCGVLGPIFDGVTWSYEYGGAVADAIGGLKYRRATENAEPLTRECALPDGSWDCLIPVPLHSRRLRTRGFNQSALLAVHLGQRFSLPVQVRYLRRVRHTPSQRELSELGRISNVRGAFSVTETHRLAGRRVLLVDDVMTTGSTLFECVRVLRDSGAEAVGAVVVARRT